MTILVLDVSPEIPELIVLPIMSHSSKSGKDHLEVSWKKPKGDVSGYRAVLQPAEGNIILIIHISSCISGSATCIEDIYNVANRTRRLCRRVRFAIQCECPKSSCTATNA